MLLFYQIVAFSSPRVTAVAKSALDVITYRLTRSDRPKGAAGVSVAPPVTDPDNAISSAGDVNGQVSKPDNPSPLNASVVVEEVDAPMEVLKDAGVILAAMKAHPMDARVQESGWRSLIAMDTGRGDVDRFLPGGGDGQRSRRQMLKDCLERHGGDSMVAGQVAAILEGLVLHGDSGETPNATIGIGRSAVGELVQMCVGGCSWEALKSRRCGRSLDIKHVCDSYLP